MSCIRRSLGQTAWERWPMMAAVLVLTALCAPLPVRAQDTLESLWQGMLAASRQASLQRQEAEAQWRREAGVQPGDWHVVGPFQDAAFGIRETLKALDLGGIECGYIGWMSVNGTNGANDHGHFRQLTTTPPLIGIATVPFDRIPRRASAVERLIRQKETPHVRKS